MKRVSRLGPLKAHFARILKNGTDEPERIYVFSAKIDKSKGGLAGNA